MELSFMNRKMAVEWLKAAKLDLDSADYIHKIEHLTPIAAFHCQQAIENQ